MTYSLKEPNPWLFTLSSNVSNHTLPYFVMHPFPNVYVEGYNYETNKKY